MATPPSDPPKQRVHDARGESVRVLACAPIDDHPPAWPTAADRVPVTQIMSRAVLCAGPGLPTDALAQLMLLHHVGCIPVVNERGRPIGLVTKLDLLERMADKATAGEIMMPLAITLNDKATVAHAAAMMAAEDIHHVPIVDDDHRVVGVVSTMDITRWLADNDGFPH